MSGDKQSLSSLQQPRLRSSSLATTAIAGHDKKSPSSPSLQFATGYELNLPPSIPLSLDGEEGAYAYTQQLLQINAETKPECYQPPPNITIRRRLSGDYDDVLGAPFHSSYTSVESTPNLRSAPYLHTERHYVSDTESSHSPSHYTSPRKGDPLPELPQQPSRELGSSCDYVGTMLFSAWRSSATSESTGATVVPSMHHLHQPRSSSADSVRRLAKLKRFFARKLGVRVPLPKQESLLSQPSAESTGLLYDKLEGAKGFDKSGVGESPWDLPPNYVDMIFTRDPVTNENQSDVVEDLSQLEIRKVWIVNVCSVCQLVCYRSHLWLLKVWTEVMRFMKLKQATFQSYAHML